MYLLANGMIRRETIVEPREISRDALLVVHTPRYLDSLNVSCDVFVLSETVWNYQLPFSEIDIIGAMVIVGG